MYIAPYYHAHYVGQYTLFTVVSHIAVDKHVSVSYNRYMIKLWADDYVKVKQLYLMGASAQEIKDELGLNVTIRTIQRRLASEGLTRTVKQSYHIAIAKGRMSWSDRKKPYITTKLSQ